VKEANAPPLFRRHVADKLPGTQKRYKPAQHFLPTHNLLLRCPHTEFNSTLVSHVRVCPAVRAFANEGRGHTIKAKESL
jgi:hypothetical protein